MKVDITMVEKLADLSKLQFDEAEKHEIVETLSNMLLFVGKLDEVEVDGVEPLIYMNENTNVMRADVVQMEITKEEALKNAPLADSDYFKVPKVIRRNQEPGTKNMEGN